MKQYRVIAQELRQEGVNPEDVWAKHDNLKWLRAQQMANKRKDLSETRLHYLEQMLGPSWMELDTTAASSSLF